MKLLIVSLFFVFLFVVDARIFVNNDRNYYGKTRGPDGVVVINDNNYLGRTRSPKDGNGMSNGKQPQHHDSYSNEIDSMEDYPMKGNNYNSRNHANTGRNWKN